MREKLIELFEGSLRYAGDVCGETGDCSKCQYDKCGLNCGYAIRADYLIANGVTVAKWIPVTERLPDCADTVLAVDRDGTMSTAYYVGYWHSGGYLDEDAVTHWMPLPEPPKGEK
jgi:hypothetical protein